MEPYIYTDSKGNEYQLYQLQNSHLVNAMLKMFQKFLLSENGSEENLEADRGYKALKEEVLKRMPIQ